MIDLDGDQRAAATTGARYALTVAAAGSGKTRTIAARVEHLLATGVHPSGIVVSTFTRKAGRELTSRIGDATTRVGTLHSFGWHEIVRPSSPLLGINGPAICDKGKGYAVIKQVLADLITEGVTLPSGKKDIEQLQHEISAAKARMGQPPDGDPANLVFDRYNSYLREHDWLDFDDILLYTCRLLEEHDSVRVPLASGITNLLIDEAQDLNIPQLRMVQHLCSEGAALFAVGDADQAIYGWRGAAPDCLHRLRTVFDPLEVFHLPTTYRCSPPVVNLARTVIGQVGEAFDGARAELTCRARSETEPPGTARVQSWPSVQAQCEQAVAAIGVEVRSGRAVPSDFAILYRARGVPNRGRLRLRLSEAKLPFVETGALRLADRKEVADMLAFAEIFVAPDRAELATSRILKWLSPLWGLGLGDKALKRLQESPEGLPLIFKAVNECKPPGKWQLADLVSEGMGLVEDEKVGPAQFFKWARTALRFDDELARRSRDGKDVFGPLEEMLVQAAGAEIDDVGLEDFCEALMLEGDLDEGGGGGAVTISTVHGSKGLEWRHVFVVGVDDDVWPDRRSEPAEEGRLLYVAVTRAIESVTLFHTVGMTSRLLRSVGVR